MKDIKNSAFLKAPDKILGIDKDLINIFLLPLAVVVGFIFSLGLVIIPKVDSIKNNLAEIGRLQTQVKEINQKKNYLTSVDVEELNKNASYLEAAVLKEKKSYLLVGVIRNIADKFGFQIRSFSVSPGEIKDTTTNAKLKVSDKEVATRMPVAVVLVGPGDKNLEVIKALETSLPILFIDRFSSKTISGISELELTVSSYYVPDKNDYISGNLSLSDLQLTQKESDLISKISEFGIVEENGELKQEEFKRYERSNPFSL